MVETYKARRSSPRIARDFQRARLCRERDANVLFLTAIRQADPKPDERRFVLQVAAAAAAGGDNRDAELLLLDFQELDAAIVWTEEWMASQCLFTGTVTCRDGDTGEVVAELTYGAPTKTSPAKLWGDQTGDPLADIRGALRLVSGACGASADLIVMGRNAADAFESHTKVWRPTTSSRSSRGHSTPRPWNGASHHSEPIGASTLR